MVEELALMHAHRMHGNKWAEIAKALPGRYPSYLICCFINVIEVLMLPSASSFKYTVHSEARCSVIIIIGMYVAVFFCWRPIFNQTQLFS